MKKQNAPCGPCSPLAPHPCGLCTPPPQEQPGPPRLRPGSDGGPGPARPTGLAASVAVAGTGWEGPGVLSEPALPCRTLGPLGAMLGWTDVWVWVVCLLRSLR